MKTCVDDRWSYMHRDVHGAAFACDPEYVDTDIFQNQEVMRGFRNAAKKMFEKKSDRLAVQRELLAFRNKKGIFATLEILECARDMPSVDWWEMHGQEVPLLQRMAMRLLSKTGAMSS